MCSREGVLKKEEKRKRDEGVKEKEEYEIVELEKREKDCSSQ